MKDISLAIDLGGTRVKIGLFEQAELLEYAVFPSFREKRTAENMALVDQQVAALCKKAGVSRGAIQRIGLAFPGLVDGLGRKVISSKGKYEDAVAFDFKKWALDHYHAALHMDNDARLACLGEKMAGAGKGFADLVMVTFGTGIGTGVIMEDRLLTGKHQQGGCLGGHFPIVANGRKCHCGNRGCLEAETSLAALRAKASEHPAFDKDSFSTFDFQQLFSAYREKEVVALEVATYCMSLWATGLVAFIHAYDPEAIILGGGVMQSADTIVPFLQNHIEKYAWTPRHKVNLLPASLGDLAGLYGAYHKALDKA